MKNRYNKYKKRASDPISAMINKGLDALNDRVSAFVTSEMNQIAKMVQWIKRKQE